MLFRQVFFYELILRPDHHISSGIWQDVPVRHQAVVDDYMNSTEC